MCKYKNLIKGLRCLERESLRVLIKINEGGLMLQNLNSCEVANVSISQFELINLIYKSKLMQKIDIPATAKLVLYALVHHYNPANEDMFPSQKFIAQSLGISEKSVERAVKELANSRLIMYVTRNVNRYKFTQNFFDLVKLSDEHRQIVPSQHRQIVRQTNNHEHVNNNKVSFFKKDEWAKTQTGRANPTVAETKELLKNLKKDEEVNFTPKDFSEEDARKWLNALPPQLHGGVLAQEVYKKYGFKMPENVKEVLISRGKSFQYS